jgi:hypothetical protein
MSNGDEYSFSKLGYLGLAWCVRDLDVQEQCSWNDNTPNQNEEVQEQCSWNDHTPNPRFAVQQNMVLDKDNDLVWEQSPSTDTVDSWSSAGDYCAALNLGNHSGWRLPTLDELASLVDLSQQSPALPVNHPFSNIKDYQGWYWSSTTPPNNSSEAYFVDMSNGDEYSFSKLGYLGLAWCVRDLDVQEQCSWD